jgi:hypothetical protein
MQEIIPTPGGTIFYGEGLLILREALKIKMIDV